MIRSPFFVLDFSEVAGFLLSSNAMPVCFSLRNPPPPLASSGNLWLIAWFFFAVPSGRFGEAGTELWSWESCRGLQSASQFLGRFLGKK